MHYSRVAAIGLAVALCASQAMAYTPYHELRNEFTSIDAAVSAMSSSDIHGSFNRLSAILDRGNVRDLTEGEWLQLPGNFQSGMLSALEDLQADLQSHMSELSEEQRLTIMQVVDVVVFERMASLYNVTDSACPLGDPPAPPPPCFVIRPSVVISVLDNIAVALRDDLIAMIVAHNTANPTNVVPVPPNWMRSPSFEVPGTFLTIKGVESIDD